MNRAARFTVAALLFGSAAARASTAEPPAVVRPPNAIALFNGRDLSGWRLFFAERKTDPSAATVTPEGALRLETKLRGCLATSEKFSNYRLQVEWRWPKDASPNSNSGVLLHLNGPDAIWPACFECQLKSGNAGQVVGMGLDIPAAPMVSNRKRAPRLAAPAEKPLGEWNTCEITCRGTSIEVLVNGVRQNHVENLPVAAGAIALQLEGFPIEFRNIRLTPL